MTSPGAQSDWACISEPGARERNEDACLACPHPHENAALFVVSDGLGGQSDGAAASRAVVDAARAAFVGQGRLNDPREAMMSVLMVVNAALRELAARSGLPREQAPDATIVVLLIHEGRLTYAHQGDSRLYRVGKDGARPLTTDHSVAALIRSTLPPREDPDRARLIRTASNPPRRTDIVGPEDSEPGTGLLLCTDGLWQAVSDAQIHADFLQDATPRAWTAALRRRVLALGDAEQDNFTALAVRAPDPPARWWRRIVDRWSKA